MHPIPLTSITSTTFTSDVSREKPSYKPIIFQLQAPNGLPSLVPYIQSSDFSNHIPIFYSSSRPSDGSYHLPVLHTRLKPIVSLSQTPYEPPSDHFIPFILEFSPFHLNIHFESTDSIFQSMMLFL